MIKYAGQFLWLLMVLAAQGGRANSTNFLAKLAPVPPFPAVSAAATAAGIPVSGIDSPVTGGALVPGDSETGLITLHEKGGRATQWLIQFLAVTNQPSAKTNRPMVLYTSTGGRYEFAGAPAGIHVRILGPFAEPSPRRHKADSFDDKGAQVFVNQDFLSLGLDGGAAAIRRWTTAAHAAGATNFVDVFDAAEKPFDSARTNADAALAARYHVTSAEERAVVCWDPVLSAYFDVVGKTPKLDHILMKVISLPSLWSFVKNAGVNAEFAFDNDRIGPVGLATWGFPGEASDYMIPSLLTINKHPSLALTFLVTAPRPPLLASGGVLGFLAENPEVEDNYLTLRIIAARRCVTAP